MVLFLVSKNFGFSKLGLTVPSPSPTYNLTDTKDWKTYANADLGFEFKYPGNYSSSPFDNKNLIVRLCPVSEACEPSLVIRKLSNSYASFEEWYEEQIGLSTYQDSKGKLVSETIEGKSLKVGNLNFLTDEETSAEDNFSASAFISLKDSDILELIITVDASDDNSKYEQAIQLRNQILSTFKFTK